MAQKAHLFHGQFRVKRSRRELLPPSLGGRYTPVSKLYFLLDWFMVYYLLAEYITKRRNKCTIQKYAFSAQMQAHLKGMFFSLSYIPETAKGEFIGKQCDRKLE
jgi:hypothetical protein